MADRRLTRKLEEWERVLPARPGQPFWEEKAGQYLALEPVKKPFGLLEVDLALKRLLRRANQTNVGPQGFGGSTTALCVNIETYGTHIAGLPVAVNIGCHVTRHSSFEL